MCFFLRSKLARENMEKDGETLSVSLVCNLVLGYELLSFNFPTSLKRTKTIRFTPFSINHLFVYQSNMNEKQSI